MKEGTDFSKGMQSGEKEGKKKKWSRKKRKTDLVDILITDAPNGR